MSQIRVLPVLNQFASLTADDLADIGSLFDHSPRSYATDIRDLRIEAARKPAANCQPLSFSLRSVFPSNN